VCVTKATIRGATNGSVVHADIVISCTANNNAYSPANYVWTNEVDGFQSTGPLFLLKPGSRYKLTCNASNNFHDHKDECYATDYVEFNSKLL